MRHRPITKPKFSAKKDAVRLEKVTIYYSIQRGSEGSAYPDWFLTEQEAERDQDNMDEGWG